jgi:chromosome partitioning protein
MPLVPKKKIAVSTHKGGTGKTATALSLAAGLSKHGRCLLIDLDPQGNSTIGLAFAHENGTPTLVDFFSQYPGFPFERVVHPTNNPNLHLAPAILKMAWTAEGLSGLPKKEHLLTRALRSVEDRFDWIVMDAPSNLGVMTQNAVTAADIVVMPAMYEADSGDAIADLLELVQLMKGSSFEDYRILITRVDSRKTRTNDAMRQVLDHWQDKLFSTTIPQNEAVNQAKMAQQDIFTFDPTSKAALAYGELIKELLRL